MKSRFVIIAASLALSFAFVTGCEQEEGERCQSTADCADGLLCNQATQSCAPAGGGDIDATVPDIIDAPPEPVDAPPDAGPGSGSGSGSDEGSGSGSGSSGVN